MELAQPRLPTPSDFLGRTAVATLDEAGIDYTVRRYLDDAPTPRAIQRPIITAADGTTVVGRDPDALARVVAAEPTD